MSERNIQTNILPDRRDLSAAAVVFVRSTGYCPPFYGFGYCFSYTGGLFTYGRSYGSQAA